VTRIFCDLCDKYIGNGSGYIRASITVIDNEYPGMKIEKIIDMCYDCGKRLESDYKLIEAPK
jgi:hypothetical protein